MSPQKKLTAAALAALHGELDELTARRAALRTELEQVNARCTELDVELYKAGVPRAKLVDRPFTAAYLDRVLGRAGLGARKETGKS
jgi:hypothetical protein